MKLLLTIEDDWADELKQEADAQRMTVDAVMERYLKVGVTVMTLLRKDGAGVWFRDGKDRPLERLSAAQLSVIGKTP